MNLDDLDSGKDGDGGDMQKMLEGMMAQLMSKDILFDPLKELSSKVRRRYLLLGPLNNGLCKFRVIVP